jgi:hypothetical protein
MTANDATPDSVRLRAEADDVVAAAVERHHALVGVATQYARAEQRWRELAGVEAQQRRTRADAAFSTAQAGIVERSLRTRTALADSLLREVATLAPESQSWPWEADGWAQVAPGMAPRSVAFTRVGRVEPPLQGLGDQGPATRAASDLMVPELPALVPLLDHAGWFVGGAADDFVALLHGTLLRLYAAVPLHRIEVTVFDPAMALPLGVFAPLRDAAPRSIAPTLTAADDFRGALRAVVAGMVQTSEEVSNLGVRNVGEHWASLGQLSMPYRLVVINDYPRGITKEIHDSLLQIASTRGAHGVSMIVHRSGPVSDREHAQRELIECLEAIEVTPTTVSTAALPRTAVRFDGPPPRAVIERVVSALSAGSDKSAMPTLALAELIDEMSNAGGDMEPDGMRAPFGREGRKAMDLRLLSDSPPLPHALVGGATGQGKSNLLLAIIHSLAARYRPDDLRMYLLDFRQGVELSVLGPTESDPTWLPHAEVLGLESDREFGLSVLRHLAAQFDVRSDLIQAAGVKSIIGYHASGARDMPRLLLLVDEFQMLLDGDDDIAAESVRLLEQIARQGRGYGVHMILASQTISGIRSLAVKGDAIFGQFPVRLSLRNTPAESEAILGRGNKAAAELKYRGEIILNEDFGNPDLNHRGIVALADDDYTRRLRQRLWHEAGPSRSLPQVFDGSKAADLDVAALQGLASAHTDHPARSYRMLLGIPVAVNPEPVEVTFERENDQAIMLAGSDQATAAGVLSAAVASIAMQSDAAARWVILDGTATAPAPGAALDTSEWVRTVIDFLSARGHNVNHVPRSEVRAYLTGPGRELAADRAPEAPDTFVLLIAPQRVSGLETGEMIGNDFVMPADVLRTIVRTGSLNGVFTLGWWLNPRAAEATLQFQTPGVGVKIVFGLSREDMQGVVDPRFPLPEASPRIVIKDARRQPELRVAIPFAPLTPAATTTLLGVVE